MSMEGKDFGETLKNKLHENLTLEVDRRAAGFLNGRVTSTSPVSTRVCTGGNLQITLHRLNHLPKKLHMKHRKTFHCIVTCGHQIMSTQTYHIIDEIDDSAPIEETISFKYSGEPTISVEVYDSGAKLRRFHCLGKADFIISQSLLRSTTGWRGTRELVDIRTQRKSRGSVELSIVYTLDGLSSFIIDGPALID